MSKWLCIGCGKFVEDDCIQAGCMACRRKANDDFFKRFLEYMEKEDEEQGEVQTMRINHREH